MEGSLQLKNCQESALNFFKLLIISTAVHQHQAALPIARWPSRGFYTSSNKSAVGTSALAGPALLDKQCSSPRRNARLS